MNVALLLKTPLPDTTRRIQTLLGVLGNDISDSSNRTQFKNEKLQCLRQRLMDARHEAALLVFRQGSDYRYMDSIASGTKINADQYNLSVTVDVIESDWHKINSSDMIDSGRNCCDEETTGGEKDCKQNVLGKDTALPSVPTKNCTGSFSKLDSERLRRPKDVENVILAFESKQGTMDEEQRELFRTTPIARRSNDRSLAMANVKYLREKLQHRVASLDTFKLDAARMYQEVIQLRKKEKRLTDELFHHRVSIGKLKVLNQMLERQVDKLLLRERCGSNRWTNAGSCETHVDDFSRLNLLLSRQFQEVFTSPNVQEGPITKLEHRRERNIPLTNNNFADRKMTKCHLRHYSNSSVLPSDPEYMDKQDVVSLTGLGEKISHQVHLPISINTGWICDTECLIDELSFSKCS